MNEDDVISGGGGSSTPPRHARQRSIYPDRVDGDLSIDMSTDIMKMAATKDRDLLSRIVWAKLIEYYFRLCVIFIILVVSLVCIACGMSQQIFPMLVTYVLGMLSNRDKAGKCVKKIINRKIGVNRAAE